jgi:hypothetical protein
MHSLSSVYFVKHLYMFRAYLQPIIRRYIIWIKKLVLIVLFRWLSVVLDGLELKINCASIWFSLNAYIVMHGQQNTKMIFIVVPCILIILKLFSPTNAHLIENTKCKNLQIKTSMHSPLHISFHLDHLQSLCSTLDTHNRLKHMLPQQCKTFNDVFYW